MFPGYELLFLVLVPASLFDLWRYQVPNALHGSALIISLIRRLETQGTAGLVPWNYHSIFPLLYVLPVPYARGIRQQIVFGSRKLCRWQSRASGDGFLSFYRSCHGGC